MLCYKLLSGACLRRTPGRVDKYGLPKIDHTGRTIDVNYFRDSKDVFLKVVAIACNVLGGVLMIAFMAEVAEFADALTSGNDWHRWLWLMVFTCVGLGAAIGVGTFLAEWSAERQLLQIRRRFLHEVMRQDMGYFDGYDATALSSKLLANTRVLRNLLGIRTSTAYKYLGIIIAGICWGLYNFWQIGLVSLSTLPIIVVAGWLAGRVEYSSGIKARAADEAAESVALEAITNIKTVKAFNLQEVMVAKYKQATDTASRMVNKAAFVSGLGFGIYWLLIFLSSALGYWYGAHFLRGQVDNGCFDCELHSGKIVITYLMIIVAAFFIGRIIPWITELSVGVRAMRETVSLYERQSLVDPYSTDGIVDLSQVRGEITISNLEFAYPTRAHLCVFKDLNLTIPAGKTVALVGASGCGKSTVIQLIMRFYDPQRGTIALDGKPITSYNIKQYRSIIGFVSQEPKLFATSVHDNIAVGKPDATLEEVVEAAKKSNAHDFIEALPQKYETWVGEGGGQLSGGQKQRIAIARALIRKPKILILDEATSALDNKSEKVVQDTLDQIVASTGITTIVIAHRLSTIRNADKIIVLNPHPDTGSIVKEEGTHADLSAIPNGIYAALVNMQKMPEADDEEDEWTDIEDDEPLRAPVATAASLKTPPVVQATSGEPLARRASAGTVLGRLPSKDLAALNTQSSLFLRSDYRPQRIVRRTAAPLLRSWWQHLLGVSCAIAYMCIWPIYGYMFGKFMMSYLDAYDEVTMTREVRQNARSMILIGVGSFVAYWGQRFFITQSSQSIVRTTRVRAYDALLKQEGGFFDQTHRSPAALSHVLSSDTNLLGDWVASNTTTWISTAVALGLGWIIVLCFNVHLGWWAFLVLWLVVPITFVGAVLLSSGGSLRFWSRRKDRRSQVHADMAAFITNAIINIRTVTAYNLQPTFEAKFDAMVQELQVEGYKQAILASVANGLSNMLKLLCFTLMFYRGAVLMAHSQMSGNDMLKAVLAFLLAALQVGYSLAGAVPWAMGKDAARSTWSLIDRVPAIEENNISGLDFEHFSEVRFDHVAFMYPTRPTLPVYKDVNFSIPAGRSVALVGASGCGKSTAVQLIERFYDVYTPVTRASSRISSGTLKINGVDIRDYYVRALRSKIGLVSQEPALFAGTVRENVKYGWPQATDEDVIAACERANAWGFIQDMPDGLDTEVGRGGSRLSGGQKQRIAIARALVRNPQLLILDEATSALDLESERVVQEAINRLLATKQFNAIVIAHRLSTIRDCDTIVVFVNMGARGARIAEVGSHQQLMEIPDGVYKSLVRVAEGTGRN